MAQGSVKERRPNIAEGGHIMKTGVVLQLGLLAAATLFVLANPLTVSAQLSPQVVPSFIALSLTSFDPTSPVLNPTFPVPITLRHTVTAQPIYSPTHYRFSRFSDFRDATWLPYAPAPIAQIPASWFQTFTPPAGVFNRRVVLHFQVRATNPKAGRPISRITNPLTGKTEVKIEPQFLNSNTRSATIMAGFAG
jgi:hypothetical protein